MKAGSDLRARLAIQRALFGLLQAHPNPALSELAAACGYDFLILDREHGLFSEQDIWSTLRAVSASDLMVWVRLSGHDTPSLGRYLDADVDGLVIPNVSTAEQARALVRAVEYPPQGTRGYGASMHRVSRYGIDIADHLEAPRGRACLIVMIESAVGVANVEEILAVPGVDGAFVGPSDLSADLGHLGDFSQPAYAEALNRVEHVAASLGRPYGTAPHGSYSIQTLLERGHQLVLLGGDAALIREAMITQLTTAKAWL